MIGSPRGNIKRYRTFGKSPKVRFSWANSSAHGSWYSSGHNSSDSESETRLINYSIVLLVHGCADDDSPLSKFSMDDFQSPHLRKHGGL